MKQITNISRITLLLLCGLCMAGGAQATTVWKVTSTADDGGTGTFRYIMTNLDPNDDDNIIEFDDALANDTIKLSSTLLYAFGSRDNLTGKNLTVRGNGVTISGSYLFFGHSNANSKMNNLWVENIHFADSEGEGIYFSAQSGRVRNCSFSPTANSPAHLCIHPKGGTILFEGCAFTAKAGSERQPYVLNSSSAVSKVSFVSCTFVKPAGSYDVQAYYEGYGWYTMDSDHPFISFGQNGAIEMTNCVVMDTSTGQPTFSVKNSKLATKGYNVILQGSVASTAGYGWPALDAAGDNVMSVGDTEPLILDEGIYKVNTTQSPAYRHLPSQSVLASNDVLAGIEFPEKDLAGDGIDYTCKTHSGAWQAVRLAGGETEPPAECDGAAATGITLTPPAETVYTENGAYTITAAVAPGDASQAVTWTSSDEGVATIVSDGSNTGRITPLAAGTTTLTAISVATPAVTQTCEITVVAYPHVESITLELDTIRSAHHLQHRVLSPVISPEGALNKAFTWTIIDPDNVLASRLMGGVYTLAGKQAGTAKLAVTATDGGATDTCVLVFTDPHYTDGVFMITEGNYPGEGRLNFLHPDGTWDYDLYTAFNNPVDFQDPARNFGVTSQFGTIYGGKFYVTSKQGARLVTFDPVTIEQHKEFWSVPGDGRAFLGVDEHTGYMGSSNGIHVVNLDDMFSTPDKVVSSLPATTVEGTQSGSGLYTGQVGTMVRVGERVFAVHQSQGILVINARTHTVETALNNYHYAVLTQSYDGYLWGGATITESTGELIDPEEDGGQGGLVDETQIYNALIRIDPWTLEEKVFPLPAGIGAPPSTWAAWQADAFSGSPTENSLYWIDRKTGPQLIRRYDIATGTVTTIFDSSTYPIPDIFKTGRWSMYGPSFRIHPVTGDMYIWITLFHLSAGNTQRQYWEVHRINPVTGQVLGIYPLKLTYWWPSMFIFPDNADPEVDASFPTTVTLSATHLHDTLALRPLVSDADNMDAAIIKTVEAIGDPALVSAFIRHDSLIIIPLKDLNAAQATNVSLKFNSNGKVVTRTLAVTVQPGAIAHPVTGVTLNRTTADLETDQTLQLTATVAPPDADNRVVTWTSSRPDVASVDQNGLVTAHLAPATVAITATTLEGGHAATCTVTTKAPSTPGVVVNPFELTQQSLALVPGQSVTLGLTAPQHFTVTWRSTVPSVATVSATGQVTSLAAGTTLVIARDVAQGRADTCLVTVTATSVVTPPSTESLSLNTAELHLLRGETSSLRVTVSTGLTPPSVVWSTSNRATADVTSSGTVIGVAAGTAIIRATSGSLTAECVVIVTEARDEPSIDNVSTDAARLTFPRVAAASYYLVHLYEMHGARIDPLLSLKVTPDGRVTLRSTAAGQMLVPLSYLAPSTSYVATIETVRETSGRVEVLQTDVTAFTTRALPTGVAAPPSAAVWHADGTLHLHGLEGAAVNVLSLSGRSLHRRQVDLAVERHALPLPAGMYILTADGADGRQRSFKFVVR